METLLAALLAVAAVAGATAEVHNDIVQNNQATAKDALKAIIQLHKTQAKPKNVATAAPPPDQTSQEGRLLDLLEGMPVSSARARKLAHSPSNVFRTLFQKNTVLLCIMDTISKHFMKLGYEMHRRVFTTHAVILYLLILHLYRLSREFRLELAFVPHSQKMSGLNPNCQSPKR